MPGMKPLMSSCFMRHLASLGRDGLDLADDLELARRRPAAARRHRGEQDEHERRERAGGASSHSSNFHHRRAAARARDITPLNGGPAWNQRSSCSDVSKSFGPTKAVNGMNLAVPRGAVYGVIGPSGAGKTTCIRMIMSILFPDSG